MDKRTTQTKEKIRLTLLKLIKQKPLEDITVSELCASCNIHRKTFYSYYKKTVDVLNECYDKLNEEFLNLYSNGIINNKMDFKNIFNKLNTFILQNLDTYHLLANTCERVNLIERANKIIRKALIDSICEETVDLNRANKFKICFIINGSICTYLHWLNNPSMCSISYVSATCINICKTVLN